MSDRIVLFSMISLLIFVSFTQASENKVIIEDEVVATVNGRPIYTHQLVPRTKAALAKRIKYGGVSDEKRHLLERSELEKLIDFELLTQAGEKWCEQTSTGLQEKRKPGTCVDEYLKQQGLEEVSVSDAEIKRYYEQNKHSFKQGEAIKVSHILVRLPAKPTAEEIYAAEKKIVAIRNELLEKDNFPETARKHSDCASATTGGDLGFIQRGYMPADFDKVAFELPMGEISSPVKTRHGFHIIKVSGKKGESFQDLDEVKELIKRLLVRNTRDRKIAEITQSLKGVASVEIKLK